MQQALTGRKRKSVPIIRFTPQQSLIIAIIALPAGAIATLLDGADNTYFFNWVFTFINPDGPTFYKDAMLFVSVLMAVGAYIFVNFAFLRGGGHHKTEAKQQQATDLHGYDAEVQEDDEVNDFFANLASGSGLGSMGLMIVTNIIGLFLLEGSGVVEHGSMHLDRLIVAVVWNIVVSVGLFAMSTLGLIIGFAFLRHAMVGFRRDARIKDSAGKTMPKPQPQEQQEQGQSQQQRQLPPAGGTNGSRQQLPQPGQSQQSNRNTTGPQAIPARASSQQQSQGPWISKQPAQTLQPRSIPNMPTQRQMAPQRMANQGQKVPPSRNWNPDRDEDDDGDW